MQINFLRSKIVLLVFVLTVSMTLTSCAQKPVDELPKASDITDPLAVNESEYTRFEADYGQIFDTYITFIGYAKSQQEFDKYSHAIRDKLVFLNQQFDIYNEYPGFNNLKNVNDNAGMSAVDVDASIIDLLKKGKLAYTETDGAVNIGMGAVLRLWHSARDIANATPTAAELPDFGQLKRSGKHINIDNLIIDEAASTVFLTDKDMFLDVGAIAKGYSAQKAVEEAKKLGLISGILNAGGNVISVGKPLDSTRERWGVGVEDPLKKEGETELLDVIFVNDMAIVTSGNYQRYFTVSGKNYNHIVDSKTLLPAENFSGVTILHPDSFVADMLSTALFILPYEKGAQLIDTFGAEALWVHLDGKTEASEGYKRMSKTFNGYSAND